MSWLAQVHGYGTHAARPAAGSAGRLYYETDTAALFRDSGTAWVALPLGSGAPSLVKLDEMYLDTGPASTFHFTAIDQSYNALRLILRATTTEGTDASNRLRVFFDADLSSTNYGSAQVYDYGTSGVGGGGIWNDTGAYLTTISGTATIEPLLQDVVVLDIPGYADTNIQKAGVYHATYHHAGDHGYTPGKIHWLDTRGITEILLTLSLGQFAQWSKATLYGIV